MTADATVAVVAEVEGGATGDGSGSAPEVTLQCFPCTRSADRFDAATGVGGSSGDEL